MISMIKTYGQSNQSANWLKDTGCALGSRFSKDNQIRSYIFEPA